MGKRGPYSEPGKPRVRGARQLHKTVKGKRVEVPGWFRPCYVDAQGKQRELPAVRGKRRADEIAGDYVRELEKESRRATDPDAVTVGYLVENWPRGARLVDGGSDYAERVVRYIIPYLPSKDDTVFASIRSEHVLLVQDALLTRRLGKSTIDGATKALAVLWKDAAKLGLVAKGDNPAQGVTVDEGDQRLNPSKEERPRRHLSLEEVCAFAVHLPVRWQPICLLPLFAGDRPGEFFATNVHHFDRAGSTLHIEESVDRSGANYRDRVKTTRGRKPEKGRDTLLPPMLVTWIDEVCPIPIHGYLVRSKRGKPYSRRNFYRDVWTPAMNQAVEQRHIEPFTLYDLRHTFISELAAIGIPMSEIGGWVGHAPGNGPKELEPRESRFIKRPRSTTERVYVHPTNKHHDTAIEHLQDMVLAVKTEIYGSGPQLTLDVDTAPSIPESDITDLAREFSRDPARGIKHVLDLDLPLALPERVPISLEIVERLTAADWQGVLNAYSPQSELRRRLAAVAPTNRGAKRQQLLQAAADYFQDHGHLTPSRTYRTPDGLALGKFLANQRQRLASRESPLTPEQVAELDAISPCWRPAQAS